MTEIKRCPFCGSKPRVYHNGLVQAKEESKTTWMYRTYWTADCGQCGGASLRSSWTTYIFNSDGKFYIDGDYDGRKDVISRWNERA